MRQSKANVFAALCAALFFFCTAGFARQIPKAADEGAALSDKYLSAVAAGDCNPVAPYIACSIKKGNGPEICGACHPFPDGMGNMRGYKCDSTGKEYFCGFYSGPACFSCKEEWKDCTGDLLSYGDSQCTMGEMNLGDCNRNYQDAGSILDEQGSCTPGAP